MTGERADVVLSIFNSFIGRVRDRADSWLDFIKNLFGPIDLYREICPESNYLVT